MKMFCSNQKCSEFGKIKERSVNADDYSCVVCNYPLKFRINNLIRKQNEIAKAQLREYYG